MRFDAGRKSRPLSTITGMGLFPITDARVSGIMVNFHFAYTMSSETVRQFERSIWVGSEEAELGILGLAMSYSPPHELNFGYVHASD